MLRKLRARLGIPGIVIILLAPILTALATAALTPQLTKNSVKADMQVGMYPLVGTHAAYESSSYVADYMAAFEGPAAVAAAAQASGKSEGEAKSMLNTVRLGDNTTADTTYTSDTEESAEAGLRAATTAALKQVVDADRKRAQVKYDANRATLTQLIADLDSGKALGGGVSAADAATVREQAVRDATTRLGLSAADLQATQVSYDSVEGVVRNTPVTKTTLTDRSAEYKTIAAATVAALVFAILLALFLGGRRARSAQADVDPESRTVEEAPVRPAPAGASRPETEHVAPEAMEPPAGPAMTHPLHRVTGAPVQGTGSHAAAATADTMPMPAGRARS